MNRILILLWFGFAFNPLMAQKYNTLGGIRVGDDFGLSGTQRIADKTTIDLTFQPGTFAGNRLLLLTANQHYPLLTKRLNFFIGGGLYQKRYENIFKKTQPIDEVSNPIKRSGIAFNLGAELTLGKLTVGVDYVPLVHFENESYRRFYGTSGLSLKYVFVERESKTKKFFKDLFKKKDKKKKK